MRPRFRGAAPAVATQVGGDDGVRLGEVPDAGAPTVVRLREAVEQQHGIAAAREGDEIVRLVDTAAAILSGGDRTGRRAGLQCHQSSGRFGVIVVQHVLRYQTYPGWSASTGWPMAVERGR